MKVAIKINFLHKNVRNNILIYFINKNTYFNLDRNINEIPYIGDLKIK